jgi:hypothetical protein
LRRKSVSHPLHIILLSMKVPLPITCRDCGEKFELDVLGSDLPEYTRCPKCGRQRPNLWPLGNAVTILLMERAKQELAAGDVTIAILLSAMAVEGEMAFLFFKWKGLDVRKLTHEVTEADKKEWENDWKGFASFRAQLDAVSRLLTYCAFDEFALANKGWLLPALHGFDPATSVKQHFQNYFYNTRTRVIHYGEVDFQKSEGERCFSLAWSLIKLFHAMDRQACRLLDEGQRKSISQTAEASGSPPF